MTPIEHQYEATQVDLNGIYESLIHMDTPAIKPKTLREKAMTVRLTTSRPRTLKRDEQAEQVAQQALGDSAITASTRLFKDKANPIRQLLNDVSAVYVEHKRRTLPYVDRGPRLLPVENIEEYRTTMHRMTNDVQNKLRALLPNYYTYVDQDIVQRNGTTGTRASRADYPTAEEFDDGIALSFKSAPLPDYDHAVFDISPEERENFDEIYKGAIDDLFTRIQEPLRKLVSTLNTPSERRVDPVTGKEKTYGIFRDTTVTNVVDAINEAKALCMGDERVLNVVESLGAVMKPIADNTDALRESPVVREMAAKKLADVQSKMAAFFGE